MNCTVMTMPKDMVSIAPKDESHALELKLLKKALRGNRDAFGQLVMRHRSQSLRIAVSMTGDIETARDLTQEAFIKAYRALGTFDSHAPFLPWFYQILRNVCRDHLRGRGRFRHMLGRFKTQAVSKADLNLDMSNKIKAFLHEHDIDLLAEMPYDVKFTEAITIGKTVVEYDDGEIRRILKSSWETVLQILDEMK